MMPKTILHYNSAKYDTDAITGFLNWVSILGLVAGLSILD